MKKQTNKDKLLDYFVLYFGFFWYSVSSVCAKLAAQRSTKWEMLLLFAAEIVFLAVYAIFYQQALKKFQLSVAISHKGITVIYGLLWSFFLFHEHIAFGNIIGAAIVISGIIMVASDD